MRALTGVDEDLMGAQKGGEEVPPSLSQVRATLGIRTPPTVPPGATQLKLAPFPAMDTHLDILDRVCL